ncbi:MAG: oligopeptide/dipeptide ABC transporter ATP-binding protein [Candidatus Onthovivens sp.]|nr:oligopeptide/dipeptide ABC transporter ATP-binding protein [Candidatus Onthovivens sp.]
MEYKDIDYSKAKKVLEVKDLRVNFKSDSGLVHAVRGVSFDLYKGETLCIVGESGSGKSVTSKTIMGILPVNAIISSGQILYDGEDLVRVSEEEFHRIRGHKIGMIFQDPLSSLNPIMKVGKQIIEATMINRNVLKRRFNELISKELVALRNEKASVIYEESKMENEVESLKLMITKLDNAIKTSVKTQNVEELNKINKVIKDYFINLHSITESQIEDLKANIERINETPINENILVNKNIKELRIETLNIRIAQYEKDLNIEYKEEESRALIQQRIKTLKANFKVIKERYKHLKPLLKDALKQSKDIAKIDNKKYYKQLVEEKDNKISVLKQHLSNVLNEINSIVPSLNEEERKLYDLLTKKKKSKKKSVITGIATAIEKEEEIVSTNNCELDKLLAQKKEIEAEIEKVNSDFVNSTKITYSEAKKIALNVMKEVGIPLPEQRFNQYPFEFSGGMRQRIVIAIALTANPDILICDEPTTALDVTIQAQILELINRLKRERQLSCIFITHDLGVVANMADRVAVMYAGKIVEYGTSYEVFFDPKHPYTWALLSSIPDIDSKEKLESIPGTPPDMRFPIEGDAFALRSKYAMAIDFKSEPPYFKVSPTHYAATWLLHPKAKKVEMPKIVKTRIENALKGAKNNEKE